MSDEIVNSELRFNKPSPASYEDNWKKRSSQKSTIGNYNYKEISINFMQEATNDSQRVPASNKYEAINMDKINERTYQAKIYKTNYPRFKPLEKDGKPGPTSYNMAESLAHSSTMMNSSKYTINKEKKSFVQDLRVKEIYSTSPASYKLETVIDKIARSSPRNVKKR